MPRRSSSRLPPGTSASSLEPAGLPAHALYAGHRVEVLVAARDRKSSSRCRITIFTVAPRKASSSARHRSWKLRWQEQGRPDRRVLSARRGPGGIQGEPGIQGPQGPQGDPEPQGIQGEPGPQGSAERVQGTPVRPRPLLRPSRADTQSLNRSLVRTWRTISANRSIGSRSSSASTTRCRSSAT